MSLIFLLVTWTWWWLSFKFWFEGRAKGKQNNQSELNGGSWKAKITEIGVRKWKFISWCSFWVAFWYGLYWWKIQRSCDEIDRGLVSMHAYSNDGGECKWVRGKVCWHYTIEGIFTPFYWNRDRCAYLEDDLTDYKEA